eukprot:gene8984-23064_t
MGGNRVVFDSGVATIAPAAAKLAALLFAPSACGLVRRGACEPNQACKQAPGCAVLASFQTDSEDDCCARCVATDGCRAWTLNTKKSPGTCWLRTAASDP